MAKVKIQVHTPFNLIMPDKGGVDTTFRKFDQGVHTVTEEEANHAWTKQHAKLLTTAEEDEAEEADESSELEGDIDPEDVPSSRNSKRNR